MLLRDGVTHHPKLLTVGAEAAWLWVAAIDYARAHLTDGFIPRPVLPTLGVFRTRVDRLADQLVQVRLFVATDGGYTINDFLEHNDSREAVLEKRRQDSERKKGQPRGGLQKESDRNPPGIHPEPEALARARVRVVAGTGSGVESSASEEGSGEKPFKRVADYWEAWRASAGSAGTDIKLPARHTEYQHLCDIADAYTLDDFLSASRCWWASRYVASRSLGLFKSQIADVLAHLASGSRAQFRAPPPPAGATAKAAPAYRSHADWVCPHEPHCGGRRACETRQALDAEKAKAVGA